MLLYIDPAATSYIIQVIAGLVITLSVSVGIFWKKIRLFFLNRKMKKVEQQLKAQTGTEETESAGQVAEGQSALSQDMTEEDGVVEIKLDDEEDAVR
ncbi:hypothetical protein [Bittarella massiliensis (ex Durand et al. 2017)]|uniref:hypothetical protein n=1 Tax=Bittarella massiliensis (ex Durand et al. 2017) TaxID=1720313 RepID=UPI001AA1875D|nr:hypothetical protein [Bittarella massiliensis (ex Durand et al. 2017)]MBO1679396.1 hypothetical protein [Bittarella massiliensis (ex Durand et al. 2017)]